MSFSFIKFRSSKLIYLVIFAALVSCHTKTEVVLHPVYDPYAIINYRNQDIVSPSSPGIYSNQPYQPYYQRPTSRFYNNPYDFPSAAYPNYDSDQYYRAPNAYSPEIEQNRINNESNHDEAINRNNLDH